LIPIAYLQEWSAKVPWPDLRQVEQDLIISRALCDLFSHPALQGKIAFRGGTAINKLLFSKPLRYSEDIDLVQTQPEPIGGIVDSVRDALSWLGKCRRDQAGHSMHLTFKFAPDAAPESFLKLKIEINTREHQNLLGIQEYPFAVESSWHKAELNISSFKPEEIFGTKLRALLQRRKNRDLFDLNEGLTQLSMGLDDLLRCFDHYLSLEGHSISRAIAEQRMLEKLARSLTDDIAPLLPVGIPFTESDAIAAFGKIWHQLITRIPGESWKLSESVIAEYRKGQIPALLQ
jgi:predicted nucleotidyltransferase component of viral defense system